MTAKDASTSREIAQRPNVERTEVASVTNYPPSPRLPRAGTVKLLCCLLQPFRVSCQCNYIKGAERSFCNLYPGWTDCIGQPWAIGLSAVGVRVFCGPGARAAIKSESFILNLSSALGSAAAAPIHYIHPRARFIGKMLGNLRAVLFGPERDRGIDPGGPARRQPACQ